MTIKVGPIDPVTEHQFQWEHMTLNYEQPPLRVTIEVTRRITLRDGQIVGRANPNLRVHIYLDGEHYHGHMYASARSERGYATDFWRKKNGQREREFDESKIQKTLDQVWTFYTSPEGQKRMVEQSIAAAQEELKALAERTRLVNGWCDSLIKELTQTPIKEGSGD